MLTSSQLTPSGALLKPPILQLSPSEALVTLTSWQLTPGGALLKLPSLQIALSVTLLMLAS